MTGASRPRWTLRPRHRVLLGMIWTQRLRLAGAMASMLVVAATTATTAFLVKPILDDVFVNKNLTMLKLLPVAVVVIYLLRGSAMYLQEYLMSYVGEGIVRSLRDRLYSRISDLSLAFFREQNTGSLMSRITNDVGSIKTMVSAAVTGSLRDCFTILGLTGVVVYRDWKLALVVFVVLPLAFYPVVQFGRRVRRVSTRRQEALAELNSFLHETFAGNKIVKAFNMEAFEKQRFFERTRRLFRLELKGVQAQSLNRPVTEFMAGIGVASTIWVGGYGVIVGYSTVGTFFSFMTAVLLLHEPLKRLAVLNSTFQQGMAAADRVFDIIETNSEILETANPVTLPRGPHRVRFEQVHFAYDDVPVLRDISLEARPGEVVALVGTSGSGKTTLVNLIPRFFDVSAGRLLIDDTDIRDLSVNGLRDRIALVTQEPILFNDTVKFNVAYGNLDAPMEAVIRAAEDAFADDFIRRLPRGYDTVIGELGARLSGGEKQRLCIARALLKDAPILILDEATSSLDSESERLVQKALENLMRGRTTFVVAHRLSTVEAADRILVLAGGRVVESGRHRELLARDGEYAKLYRMQFRASPVPGDGGESPEDGFDPSRTE